MDVVKPMNTVNAMVQPKTTHGNKISTEIRTELDTLSRILENVRSKMIGEWQQVDTLLADRIRQHADYTDKSKETVASLQETYKQLESQESDQKKLCVEKAEELQRLQAEVVRVRQETESLLMEKERIQQRVGEMRDRNLQQREAIEKEEKSTTDIEKNLEITTRFFRERLGLVMKKVSGERLQFVFTCIDAKDSSRPFYFCVKINPDRTYEVTDCEPAVVDLPPMIARLNATNNFRSFVIAIRRCFKTMA